MVQGKEQCLAECKQDSFLDSVAEVDEYRRTGPRGLTDCIARYSSTNIEIVSLLGIALLQGFCLTSFTLCLSTKLLGGESPALEASLERAKVCRSMLRPQANVSDLHVIL